METKVCKISKKELFENMANSVFESVAKANDNLDRLNDAVVENSFHIGKKDDGSFALAVDTSANIPEIAGAISAEGLFKVRESEDGEIEINHVGAVITNTDEGFVYLDVDDKNKIIPAAPVINPCIFGTVERPTGIYIPFNPYSIEVGKAFIDKFTTKCSRCHENTTGELPKAPFEEDDTNNLLDDYRYLHI